MFEPARLSGAFAGAISRVPAPLPEDRWTQGGCVVRAGDRIRLYLGGKETVTAGNGEGQGEVFVHGRVFEPHASVGAPRDAGAVREARLATPPQTSNASAVFLAVSATDREFAVTISTDKFGLRPLYYTVLEDRIVFATTLAGLEALSGETHATIGADALLHFYHFGFTPNDRTLLEGVRKLPPGASLTVDARGAVTVAPYFRLGSLYRPRDFADLPERELARLIDEALARAVARRIPAGRKVGIALSGGLDSGYLAQKLVAAGADVVGYTLGYGGAYDEFQRVDVLSADLGLAVRKLVLSPEDILSTYEAAVAACSEPVGLNNGALRAVAVAARSDGVDTLFDGDGADRLFLGMNRYRQYARLLRAFAALERLRLTPLALALLARTRSPEAAKAALLFRNWRDGILPYPERDFSGTRHYDAAHERLIYDLAIGERAKRYADEIGDFEFGRFFTYVSTGMCPEMFFHTPAEIQGSLGLFAMPAFWDDDLVSIALSLPTAWKLRGGKTKYILRTAAAQRLGARYTMLPKIGLQSAYAYLLGSEAGRAWRADVLAAVRRSEEFAALGERLPGGYVDPDRLIPLALWKRIHGR